jgi:hypothetical protein
MIFGATATQHIISIFSEIKRRSSQEGRNYRSYSKKMYSLRVSKSLEIENKTKLLHTTFPFSVLRQRIQNCIDMAFDARIVNKISSFFCQETGAMWQSISDDTFNVSKPFISRLVLFQKPSFKSFMIPGQPFTFLQESPPGAILMLRKLFVKICRASQKRRSL